jgi:hypothetical protein
VILYIYIHKKLPTRSLGMIFNSEPCFRNTLPDVYYNETPVPALVIMALVAGLTLNYNN